jgi:O-antigen/teichoic acid export membrane protein
MSGAGGRGGNLVALGLGQLFRLGSAFGVNVLLMRHLGVEGFGVYGYVMTLIGLVGAFASVGMERLINRELARDGSKRAALVGSGLLATALLSLGCGALAVGWAAGVDGRPAVIGATALAAVAMGLHALAAIPEAAFHADHRMGPSARGQMAGRVALVAGTAAGVGLGFGLQAVFWAQVLDGLVTLLWIGRAAWGWMGAPAPDRATARRLVREGLPFGLQLFFGAVYLSVDVLLLELLAGDAAAGTFRGAVMLITLFPILANTLTTGYFPRLARRLGDPAGAGEELGFLCRVLLAVSLPAAVGGALVAGPLLQLVGGDGFAASAAPFAWMCALIPLRYLNLALSTGLSTLDRQGDRTRAALGSALLSVALNAALIPRFGVMGAAWTAIAVEVAQALWLRTRLRGVAEGLGLGPSAARSGLGALLMGAAVWALGGQHVLVQIAGGVVVFAVAGRALGAWSPADLRRLRRV